MTEQGQLKEERVYFRVGRAQHGGRSRRLADHIFTLTQEEERELEVRCGKPLEPAPSDVLLPARLLLLKVP